MITWQYPAAVVCALLVVAIGAMLLPRTRRRLSLIVKAAALAAIVLAIGGPAVVVPETRMALAILIDESSSVTEADLGRAWGIARQIAAHRGRDWVRVIPFARNAQGMFANLRQNAPARQITGPEAQATNIEAALNAAVTAAPFGYVPRVLLISDGKENEGSAARAIAQMRRLHVAVDTIALGGRSQSQLSLAGLSLPAEAFAGEQIPLDLTVESPVATDATVAIEANGKPLGTNALRLERGINHVRVHARVRSSGLTALSGRLVTSNAGELVFQQAIALRRARALYLSQDPPGSESNLLGALGQAEVELRRDPRELSRNLGALQLVILNNLDLNQFSALDKTALERFVEDGGGLLVIGGDRQLYKENKQLDALDRALPAKLAPPKSAKGTCVALIIDKSSSMEGRKIELARASALGVVQHLRPIDMVGVLIFDNSFQWAVPMRRVEDKALIRRLIAGITPDGGTQIAPALAEAYRKTLAANANSKHVVLLTDGISEEGNSLELSRDAARHGVTISTVGLGQDVNRTYLEKVASGSGGKSYFLTEPQGLEELLLKDVQEFSGTTAVERPLAPIVNRSSEVLSGVDMEHAPPLKGYARYEAKRAADVILSIDPEKKDPLYVRWQYGLGRAAVFASDAKSRWAEGWVKWPGFDRFWINVTRDLLSRTPRSEARTSFDAADRDLVVDYRLAPGQAEPAALPQLFALGPEGWRKPVPLRRVSAGVYQGRVHIGDARGLFRIRPFADSAEFPETGFYRPVDELLDVGSDSDLLRQLAVSTGGRFNPSVDQALRRDQRVIYKRVELWPAFLIVAIGATIAELIIRKWAHLAGRLRQLTPRLAFR